MGKSEQGGGDYPKDYKKTFGGDRYVHILMVVFSWVKYISNVRCALYTGAIIVHVFLNKSESFASVSP